MFPVVYLLDNGRFEGVHVKQSSSN